MDQYASSHAGESAHAHLPPTYADMLRTYAAMVEGGRADLDLTEYGRDYLARILRAVAGHIVPVLYPPADGTRDQAAREVQWVTRSTVADIADLAAWDAAVSRAYACVWGI